MNGSSPYLGCSIIGLAGVASKAHHRAEVDDAPFPLFGHDLCSCLHMPDTSSDLRLDAWTAH